MAVPESSPAGGTASLIMALSDYLGSRWTEWPEWHPRRPDHGKPRNPRKPNAVNVLDPDRERFSREEWETFAEGATEVTSRLAVSGSKFGAGRLDVTKTTFKNGTYQIIARLYANSEPHHLYIDPGDLYPLETGADAKEAARIAYEVKFKNGK